ncbi:MAG: hypothetical protein OEZ68_12660 [Gammaproteobacteria bacterium]|nr:hypothetical protein [Gammaproteobacteria bacterium]MDH5801648.1 hypothetical protein [Gammaproteobacteria bacterium]
MMNLSELTAVIQRNCHISDAQYAGNYSLCIFLLKMREYFRWEQQTPLTRELHKPAVSEWLQQREQLWDSLEQEPYQNLRLGKQHYDPFDSDPINAVLNPQGYVYSSGYGVFGKPHFFLGKLKRKMIQNGLTVYISSEEYARDLVAPPAMSLNNQVFIRQESLRRFIWQKIEEWQWKKDSNHPMAKAIAFIDAPDMEQVLDRLCENESENVLLHEVGETEVGQMVGQAWKDMLQQIPHSGAELQIRAVRDHLADCISTLPSLVNSGNELSLHFYFANFTGMRKQLFPGALQAYRSWLQSGDTQALDRCVQQGRRHWEQTVHGLLAAFKTHGSNITQRTDELIQAI